MLIKQDHFPELDAITWKHQCQDINTAQRKIGEANGISVKTNPVSHSSAEFIDLIRFELNAGLSIIEIHKVRIRRLVL